MTEQTNQTTDNHAPVRDRSGSPIESDPNEEQFGEKAKGIMTRNRQIRLPYEETSYGRTMTQ